MAGTCECGNELSVSLKCGKFLTSLKPVSLSRRSLLHGVIMLCRSVVVIDTKSKIMRLCQLYFGAFDIKPTNQTPRSIDYCKLWSVYL